MSKTSQLLGFVMLTLASLAGCHRTTDTHSNDLKVQTSKQAIAWHRGNADGALAAAKASGKDALLYWGAKWCAPCNRLKSTLFRDPGFIRLTERFVPIYIDGDDANAQQWGDRFHFVGYPTLILMSPTGLEIGRPDSNQSPASITQALAYAAERGQSPARLIDQGAANPASLSAADWATVAQFDARTLAFDGPQGQEKLKILAAAAPNDALRQRLALLSFMPFALPNQLLHFEPVVLSDSQRHRVEPVLWNALSRPVDILGEGFLPYYVEARLLAAMPASPRKQALRRKLLAATAANRANPAVASPDKIDTLAIDLALVRNNRPSVPAAFKDQVRGATEAALATAKNPALRQSILHESSLVRRDAGDVEGVHHMLLANLGKLTNPQDAYERLSENAEMRGKSSEAVAWLRREYLAETGPASRLRFALDYSESAMRLTPKDKAAVEQSTDAVLAAVVRAGGNSSERMRRDSKQWLLAVRKWSTESGNRRLATMVAVALSRACEATKHAGPSCVTVGA